MILTEWAKRNPRKTERLGNRVLDALREIGILLMAFGPLEAAISSTKAWGIYVGVVFFAAGLFVFAVALILEWRHTDAE